MDQILLDDLGQIQAVFANAPADTPLAELCRAATLRWPIVQCFQDRKSQVGMDQHEHRPWSAWHRHMLDVFLARHFLIVDKRSAAEKQ